MKIYEYKFSNGIFLENEVEVDENKIYWMIREPKKSLFSVRALSKKSEGYLQKKAGCYRVFFTHPSAMTAKKMFTDELEKRVELSKKELTRAEFLLASIKDTDIR